MFPAPATSAADANDRLYAIDQHGGSRGGCGLDLAATRRRVSSSPGPPSAARGGGHRGRSATRELLRVCDRTGCCSTSSTAPNDLVGLQLRLGAVLRGQRGRLLGPVRRAGALNVAETATGRILSFDLAGAFILGLLCRAR